MYSTTPLTNTGHHVSYTLYMMYQPRPLWQGTFNIRKKPATCKKVGHQYTSGLSMAEQPTWGQQTTKPPVKQCVPISPILRKMTSEPQITPTVYFNDLQSTCKHTNCPCKSTNKESCHHKICRYIIAQCWVNQTSFFVVHMLVGQPIRTYTCTIKAMLTNNNDLLKVQFNVMYGTYIQIEMHSLNQLPTGTRWSLY